MVSKFVRSTIPFLLLLSIDQFVKYFIISRGLGYHKNYGFLFGILNFVNFIFSIIVVCLTTCVSAVLLIRVLLLRHSEVCAPKNLNSIDPSPAKPDQDGVWIGLMFVLSGAMSNLLDRLARGYVVDYLDWKTIVPFWPQNFVRFFNLADIFVVLGLILIGIRLTRRGQNSENIRSSVL